MKVATREIIEKIYPCQFCKEVNSEPKIGRAWDNEDLLYYVFCLHCNCSGSRCFDRTTAIGRWNFIMRKAEIE